MRSFSVQGLATRSLEALEGQGRHRASTLAASPVGACPSRQGSGTTSPSLPSQARDHHSVAREQSSRADIPLQNEEPRIRSGSVVTRRSFHGDADATGNEARLADDAAAAARSATAFHVYDPKRNRFTQIFGAMLDDATCRQRIQRYADCVRAAQLQDDEGLTKHACQNEFQDVKDCWRHIRRQFRRPAPAPASS